MKIEIITAFPDMFESLLGESIIKKAQKNNFLQTNIYNLRDFALGKHRQIDDTPYGGGPGMLLKAEPFFRALNSIKVEGKSIKILLTPQGQLLKQSKVEGFSKFDQIIMLCGHYEGVDERVRLLVDEEISAGDYILTGGELPAMILLDAVTRKLSGVLGSKDSLLEESFEDGLLEYPQYTKPSEFEGHSVPDILLSGNHAEIARWRKEQAIERTRLRRPDLLK